MTSVIHNANHTKLTGINGLMKKALRVLAKFSLLAIMSGSFLACPVLAQASFQLTTRLGVEVTINARRIQLDDETLDNLVSFEAFILQTDAGTFLRIPFAVFRQAEFKENAHLITTTDGQELKGKLIGTISSELYSSSATKYDLKSTTKIIKVGGNTDRRSSQRQAVASEKGWELRFHNSSDSIQVISNPMFAFTYYSTSGYVMGGANRVTKSPSFYLRVDGDDVSANLPDFEEIFLNGNKTKLKSKSGVETSGTIILKGKDDKGEHWAIGEWYLYADIVGSGGVQIIIRQPQCTLTKKTR